MKRISWKRRLIGISSGAAGVLLLAALACFFFPQQVLTVDSGPVTGDVLVVLGGGLRERPERASELFKAGAAPRIICSGFGDATINEACLTNVGVPAAAIWLESKSRTTRENAQFTIAMLRARHLTNAIIVTTWYHSRRALACFEHYAPDITFYSRPSYAGYPQGAKAETLKPEMRKAESGKQKVESRNQKAEGLKQEIHPGDSQRDGSMTASQLSAFRAAKAAVQKVEWNAVRHYTHSEYLKLLGYWICYGVCPL